MAKSQKVTLKGTEHTPMPGARAIGPTSPHQLIEISVILKHRQPLNLNKHGGQILSHTDFAKTYGADPAQVDLIRQFATENNLQVLTRGDEVLRRTVTLAGTAANMEKAFNVELVGFEHPDGTYRSHTGPIQVPDSLASIIEGVFGLDNRPVAHPHIRMRNTNRTFGARSSTTTYTPLQVASLYDFPRDADGDGQTIGIIELGGGYRPADLQQYFQNLNLRTPPVRAVLVNQANNRPSTPNSADAEVMLDLEIAGAVANGASVAVYFSTNTARGFQDALSTAVHDQLHTPSVLSISWGNPEATWTQQSMECFDQVAQEAALLGITVTAASGDHGSTDGIAGNQNHADFPASCPHVLGVGGTRLTSVNGTLQNETVWNDGPTGGATGGGYSNVFQRPEWQASVATKPSRGVPDTASNADPDTGYNILVDGEQAVVGGTSACAPLWAALVARCNQMVNTRLGFINPALYAINQNNGFRDITQGNNGAFSATPGWDPCTGLGSPIGTRLLQAISTATGKTISTAAGTAVGKMAASAQPAETRVGRPHSAA
jgi:kumamolisin